MQSSASGPSKKPNIFVIFGDDIGQTNISAYEYGVVGYDPQHRSNRARGYATTLDMLTVTLCPEGPRERAPRTGLLQRTHDKASHHKILLPA
jgi:hypothetical protein